MGDILLTTEYAAIRHPLGVNAALIPDATIDGLAFLPFVEGEIQELIEDWEGILLLDDQDTKRLKLAVAYWTAARLAGHLERGELQDYTIADYTHRKGGVDWMAKAAELAKEAALLLAKLSILDPPGRPQLFIRTGPTRAGTNSPSSFQSWLDKIQPTVLTWLEST